MASAITLAGALLVGTTAPAGAQGSDAIVVFGPTEYIKVGSGSWVDYTDEYSSTLVPGRRYVLEVTNGSGGHARVSNAIISVNGQEWVGSSECTGGIASVTRTIDVENPDNSLGIALSGNANSAVSVRIYHVPDSTFKIYGRTTFVKPSPAAAQLGPLTIPTGAGPPYELRVINGQPWGTNRTANCAVDLKKGSNVRSVIGSSEFTTGIASFTRTVGLLSPDTVRVTNNGAASSQITVWVTARDTLKPTLIVDAPVDSLGGSLTSITSSGSVQDQTYTRLKVNGQWLTLAGNGTFSTLLALPNEGNNVFTFVALDAAGNSTSVTRTFVRDRTKPALAVSTPANGLTTANTSVTVEGVVTDANWWGLSVNGEEVSVQPNGTFSYSHPLSCGSNVVVIRAQDVYGNDSTLTRSVIRTITGLEAPSAPVPTALDPTVVPAFKRSHAFLYRFPGGVQRGLDSTQVDDQRVAVVRGHIVLGDGTTPLAGAKIRVLEHPELGYTVSRNDGGSFDLVVNGGGGITLRIERAGFLPVQRTIEVPWREYLNLPPIGMIGLDTEARTIVSSDTIQVARSTERTDVLGQRRNFLLFKPGTGATLKRKDGSSQTLASYTVRATEYTQGPGGPSAMPAELPASSAYTYCLELSVDEADSNTSRVDLSQSVPLYLTNYRHFPPGIDVPVGWYDRDSSVWKAEPNGRVIKILSVSGGIAALDLNDDAVADTGAALVALGIDLPERERIATLFAAGDTVIRAPIQHFSTHDLNHSWWFPFGAQFPKLDTLKVAAKDCDCPSTSDGSIVENESQVLGETVPIVGTPFTLNYRSSRATGYAPAREIEIPLADAFLGGPPASLLRITVVVHIAGQTIEENFDPNQQSSGIIAWDGNDVYGRPVQGRQIATVSLGYVYERLFAAPQAGQTQTNPLFGLFCGQTGCRRLQGAASEAVAWSTIRVPIGSQQMRAAGLGGWSLSEHHAYDPTGDGVLLLGNGDQVTGGRLSPVMSPLVAGLGANDIAFDPKSKDLIVGGNYRIYRVHANGTIDSIAGTGTPPASNNGPGDGGPATSAQLRTDEVAVGPDGSIYVVDENRIRRIWPDGVIRTIAGQGGAYSLGDGGLAVDAYVASPNDLQVGPDGAVYFSEGSNPGQKVRRIGPEGYITRFAGTGTGGFEPSDSLAASSAFTPSGLAVGDDGSIYVANAGNRVRVIRPDGKLGLIAGGGGGAFGTEGGAATSASLNFVDEVAIGPDQAVYFTENLTNVSGGSTGRIRRVGGDGIITTVAGGVEPFSGDNSPARSQSLNSPLSIAFDGEGRLLVDQAGTIRVIRPPAPGFGLGEVVWPSRDGSEYYVFSADGKHLRTHDAYTNAVRFSFEYNDTTGLLRLIHDVNGGTTWIERSGNDSIAINGPYGHRTALILASGGTLLANVRNPAGESRSFTYVSGTGLLDVETHPRSHQQDFDFANGRLLSDHDAAGGVQTLSRTGSPRTYTVTRTELGLSTKYSLTDALDGSVARKVETPDGLTTTSTETRGRVTTSNYPDGSSSTLAVSPDHRFGMRAPFASSLAITIPDVPTLSLAVSRGTYASGLALTSQTDAVSVNGKTYSSAFVRSSLTFTDLTPANRTVTTVVDTAGRPQSVSIDGLDAITYSYSARGLLETTVQGGRTWTYTHDDSGRVRDITDGLGRQTKFRYDAADRLIRQTLPDDQVIGYAYDASGNLKSLTPPGKPTHSFAYTPVDLDDNYAPPTVSGIADPLTRYQWRSDRLLQIVNRPDGATIKLHYDAYGRPDSVDTPLGNVGLHYDSHGRVDQVMGIPTDNVTLDYDYAGSLPAREEWSGALSGEVEHTYDAFFRPATQTVTVGSKVSATTSGYDDDGLMTSVSLPTGGSYGLHRRAANGLLDSTRVGPVMTEHGYNGKGELASQLARINNTVLFSQIFDRDTLGRIRQIVETELGTSHTWNYSYWTSGRLDSVKLDNVLVGRYAYDGNGNRTDVTESEGSTSADHDAQDRLRQRGGRSFSYSANGELTAEREGADSTRYRYDVLGNLRWVKRASGDSVEYVIDGQNRRVIRKQNGTITRRWLYQNGLNPIAELDGSGALQNRFVYGSQGHVPDLLIRTSGSADTVYRLVTDHLGSVRLVVNTVTGTIAQRIDYDAWGQESANSSPHWQSLSYAGGIADSLTKLVRFGARDYAARQGRWTAKDPVGLIADVNAFAYVNGNPNASIDPWGLSAADVTSIISTLRKTTQHMTVSGRRVDPSILNNMLRSLYGITGGRAGGPYLGCGEQALLLEDALYMQKYDDNWSFEVVGSHLPQLQPGFGPIGNHWWVVAKSSNPADPLLILDPWRNDYRQRNRNRGQ